MTVEDVQLKTAELTDLAREAKCEAIAACGEVSTGQILLSGTASVGFAAVVIVSLMRRHGLSLEEIAKIYRLAEQGGEILEEKDTTMDELKAATLEASDFFDLDDGILMDRRSHHD